MAVHAGVLGPRLVKRTVNFDAPLTHHLYFGDATVDVLGTALALPPWLEEDRALIEAQLPPLDAGTAAEAG